MLYRLVYLLTACCILFSCAATYKPIKPAELAINSDGTNDSIYYGYRYDVLAGTGNKKYAKKETKKGIKLVAIKFENNTDKPIVFRDQVQVVAGNRLVFPMESKLIYQQLKQPAPLYLLWGLLWVTINKCDDEDCSVTPIPVGLGIGLINLGVASGANKNFLAELKENNILDKTIKPGETVYGLIGVPIQTPDALEFKMR